MDSSGQAYQQSLQQVDIPQLEYIQKQLLELQERLSALPLENLPTSETSATNEPQNMNINKPNHKKFISYDNWSKYENDRWRRLKTPKNFMTSSEASRLRKVDNWVETCMRKRPDLAGEFGKSNGEYTFPMPMPDGVNLSPSSSYIKNKYPDDWQQRLRLIRRKNHDVKPDDSASNCPRYDDEYGYDYYYDMRDASTETSQGKLYRRDFLTKSELEDHDIRVQTLAELKKLNTGFRKMKLNRKDDSAEDRI